MSVIIEKPNHENKSYCS